MRRTWCRLDMAMQSHCGGATSCRGWDLGHSAAVLKKIKRDNILSIKPKRGKPAGSVKLWSSGRERLLILENGCAS